MGFQTVREGNAFYEIDEECLRKKQMKKDSSDRKEEKGKHMTEKQGMRKN